MIEYLVLYYKRTNKVHKSKGVSKFDGILRVEKQRVILLDKNDNIGLEKSAGSTLFSCMEKDTSKFQALQEDDVVSVGPYQVEIISSVADEKQVRSGLPSNVTTGAPSAILLKRKPPAFLMRLSKAKRNAVNYAKPKVAPPTDNDESSDSDDDERDDENKESPSNVVVPRPKLLAKRAPFQQPKTVLKNRSENTTRRPDRNLERQQVTLNSPFQAELSSWLLSDIPIPASIRPVLRSHQTSGIEFLWKALHTQKGAILADSMGSGKTLMTISILCAVHRQRRDKQFVIVCPSSLVSNWAKEFDKWIGRASQPKRVVIKKGGEEGVQQIRSYCHGMKQQLKTNGQVLIISYDLLRMNVHFFQEANISVGMLVVDEGHRLKNSNGSLTLDALEAILCDSRLCITATPIQNNLSEFYNLANFTCPGILGELSDFRRSYERPITLANSKNATRQQREIGALQSRELEKLTKSFMLRRLQKDILKSILPPRMEVLLFCKPTQMQCDLYEKISDASQMNGTFADALQALTKLRKVCLHPMLLESKQDGSPDSHGGGNATELFRHSGKLVVLDVLLAAIKENAPHDKVVIVSNFTSVLSLIERLILRPRKYGFGRLDGTVDSQSRQSLVDMFNRGSVERNFCFLLSSKAGGCGLNLVGANRLVMFDPDWNPASDIQAMGRVYRQGQTKPCILYRLFTSGTVEEVIYQRQMQKGGLATLTIDGGGTASCDRFTAEEIADCFTLKRDCDCDTKRKLGDRWPSYDGPLSLAALECDDGPLIEVAKSHSDTLRFVHIVAEDESHSDRDEAHMALEDGDDSGHEYTSEEEFEM